MKSVLNPVMLISILLACSSQEPAPPSMGSAELAEEISSAISEPHQLAMMTRLAAALQHLSPDNVEAVREVYQKEILSLGSTETSSFMDAWAEFDPAGAWDFAMESCPDTDALESCRRWATYSWALRDPEAARTAIEERASPTTERAVIQLYQPLVRAWAISGHPGHQEYILQTPGEVGTLIGSVLPILYMTGGHEKVFGWTEEFISKTDEYGPRMKALRMATRTVARRDPQGAIPFVEKHYGQDYATEGPRELTEMWLRNDSDAALNWIINEAPEQSRAYSLGMALGAWLHRDGRSAREWVESRPVGDPFYQPAFDTFARRIAGPNPKRAIEFCSRGQTDGLNAKCLSVVAVQWLKKNREDATLWLEQESGLSPEDIANVHKRFQAQFGRARR